VDIQPQASDLRFLPGPDLPDIRVLLFLSPPRSKIDPGSVLLTGMGAVFPQVASA